MPSSSSIWNNPLSKPKVNVTIKTWEPKVNLVVIGHGVQEIQMLLQEHIGCFVFNLKKLGQLVEQKVHITWKDDNPIFKQPYKLDEVKRALV
jgi:hypothetical protein